MLRCGYCEKICDSYEDWLQHLVSEEHQANLGVSDTFVKHNKDHDRNERSFLMYKVNPKTNPFEVVCYFANEEPLGFITDAYVHVFPHVNEKFYLIVFDQRKFAQRIVALYEKYGDQKVISSLSCFRKKSALSEDEWNAKLDQSFFYRRHQSLKRKLTEMNWDQQLENFVKLVSLDQNGYTQRESMIEELESLIREEYPEAIVHAFGSCMTWLADINADLDVYVDALGEQGRSELDPEKKTEIMNKVAKILRDKYDALNVYTIKHARVPIIKLSHPSGLKVDLSFENCLSVQNSKMIRLMSRLDYRVRGLLIFLKYWARFHNLVGPHSVKSYALILMTFVYLRRVKILPSIHELQHVEGVSEFTVCNWNASYCGSREATYRHLPWLKAAREAPSTEGVGHEVMKLAYGFFKEYSNFDFTTQVICPLTGSFLPKQAFESTFGKDLPCEMELLKANLVTSQCAPFQAEKILCIQDPFALNINVTSSCANPEIVIQFKAACLMAAEALKPFITNYGSAGTEVFLELCCQPITEEKKTEVSAGFHNDNNNHDHMAYVKTEATSSTREDGDTLWNADDKTMASQIAHAVSGDESHYRVDRDPDRSYGSDRIDGYKESRRRDRDSSSNRERDDARPTRIQRTSMYDNDGSDSGRFSRYSESYHSDRPTRHEDRTLLSSDEESKGKILRSSVVVPSKNITIKTEVTSSSSPSSSSSSSSREKNKNSGRKGNDDSSSSSKPLKPLVPYENPWAVNDSPSVLFTPPNTAGKRSTSNNSSSQKGHDFQDIVVVVENQSKSVPRDVINFQSASISSAPVIYNKNQTVTFVSAQKVEPVVTFISKDTPEPNVLPPPPPPPPPPPASKVNLPEKEYNYEEYEEEEEGAEEDEEDEEYVDELEEVDKFLLSLQPQIQPPDETAVRFDAAASKRSSYGYERAVQPIQKPVRQAYVPPQARTMQEASPDRLLWCFPAFSVFMSDNFQQTFNGILSDINVPEQLKDLKMKVLWLNAVTDFFNTTNNHFWQKFKPMYLPASFDVNKIQNLGLVLEMAERKRQEFLVKDYNQYSLLHAAPNRKRGNSECAQTIGPVSKMPKQDFDYPECSMEYKTKSDIMVKLGKIPANVRKSYADKYIFTCNPVQIENLFSKWQRLSSTMTPNDRRSPLDDFGSLCTTVRRSPVVPSLMTSKSKEDVQLNVRLIVALDTGSDIPGLYCGFESAISDGHPHFKIQAEFNQQMEHIIKDLIHIYTLHRLLKYFKI